MDATNQQKFGMFWCLMSDAMAEEDYDGPLGFELNDYTIGGIRQISSSSQKSYAIALVQYFMPEHMGLPGETLLNTSFEELFRLEGKEMDRDGDFDAIPQWDDYRCVKG